MGIAPVSAYWCAQTFNVAHQMVQASVETVAMFGDVASSVRKAFDENGSVECSLICETEDGQRVIFEAAGALTNHAVAIKKLRKLFWRLKVARYVRVTRCRTDSMDAGHSSSENTDCGEGVMILAIDNTSVRMCSIAEIKHGADGKVTLGAWEPIEISDGWRSGFIKVRRDC
jgi:hypothetical protein